MTELRIKGRDHCSLLPSSSSAVLGAVCLEPGGSLPESSLGRSVWVPPRLCRAPEKAIQGHEPGRAAQRTAESAGRNVHPSSLHARGWATVCYYTYCVTWSSRDCHMTCTVQVVLCRALLVSWWWTCWSIVPASLRTLWHSSICLWNSMTSQRPRPSK